jgi:hypothetical protein
LGLLPIHDGGNPYENLTSALKQLGLRSTGAKGYESQFGIVLNGRSAVEIEVGGASNLRLDDASTSLVSGLVQDVSVGQQPPEAMAALQSMMRLVLDLNEGETIMWLLEPPAVPEFPSEIAFVATAADLDTKQRVIGKCANAYADVGHGSTLELFPESAAGSYMWRYENRELDFSKNSTLSVLRKPSHGKISTDLTEYSPYPGFVGKDFFILQVRKGDIKVQVQYNILVADGPWEHVDPKHKRNCGTTGSWKISDGFLDSGADVAAWLRSADLTSILAAASQVETRFSDFAGATLGTTTGEGLTAQITLDTDAAGHG